jgi:hypothetical protein
MGMVIKNGITIEEGSAPSTETGFGKVYVDSGSNLHYLDGYGNDTNLVDGYNIVIKSVFIDTTSGTFDYDTDPEPTFRDAGPSGLFRCASLDGAYNSGIYQEFRFRPIQIPLDYESGGIIKIYAQLTDTSGDVMVKEISLASARNGLSLGPWYGVSSFDNVITMVEDVWTQIGELDLNHATTQPGSGDFVVCRVQRRAGDASDNASSGYLAILGAEFIYNANIPKKTY